MPVFLIKFDSQSSVMNWLNRFLLSITLFLTSSIFGQGLYFRSFTPAITIPSTETYRILQDKQGYIWITTDAGICRYDGKELKIYTPTDGISENVVFGIYEDTKGRVWFSTMSGYFFYFFEGEFVQIAANRELKKLCNPHTISSFFIGSNDTLFCTTPSAPGFLKISPQNNYKQIIQEKGKYYDSNRFIVQNKNHPDESICGRGMEEINPKDSTFSLFYNNRKIRLSIKGLKVQSGNGWHGRSEKSGNIYILNGNILSVVHAQSGKTEKHSLPQSITYVYEDTDGDLWVGVKKNGVYLYKKGNLNSKPINSLSPYSVSSIFVDKEGTVWATTLEKGIFRCFSKKILDEFCPNEKVVDFQISEEQLFAGLSSNTLLKFNKEQWWFEKEHIRLPGLNFIESFYQTKTANYYGANVELFYSERTPEKLSSILYGIQKVSTKKIIPLSADTLLAVSLSNAYILYKDKIIEKISFPFRIGSIIKLSDGEIIIGSKNNSGLYVYRHKFLLPILGRFEQLKTRINALKEDAQGNIWISTNERGFFCLSKDQHLYVFDESFGLISNKVNTIDIDKNGCIWVGTNKGLSKLTINKEIKDASILNFNGSHGIPALEIDQLIAFDEGIWCGTKEHLFYFRSDELQQNTVPPLCHLRSVLVGRKQIDPLTKPILNYDENNINIEFQGMSFKNEGRQKFMYKLEGYDNDWKYSNSDAVQYTNLNHGKYHFIVYAFNNDGVKSKEPAEFSFEISAPLWFRWEFIFLEILLAGLFIYKTAQWWANKVRKKEAEKTLLNQKIAEFHMTALRAQMNPHFVFNAISSIQHYILKNDTYKSYDYLAKFSLLIRNVLDNSQEEYISIRKEIDSLRLYIELEQIRFNVPFEFSLTLDENLNTDEYVIPTMLLQPFIENAIWHGLMPKQKDCKLSISFQEKEGTIAIVITDNGIGRETSEKTKKITNHHSKGMNLSEQRIQALSIKHQQMFTLQVLDLKDEEDKPAGTSIIITIPAIEF